MRTPGRHGWNFSVVGALVAAALLLSTGVLMANYEDQLYSAQQVKSVREQAQILAASVTAAITFDDRSSAQEYIDALKTNPELQAAGVYDVRGHMLAGFDRGGTRLPATVTKPVTSFSQDYLDVSVQASQNGTHVGTVMLRAITEPAEHRYIRYSVLILLVTSGALVITVLSFSQRALSRRAQQLSNVNKRLQEEMEERRKTEEALRQSHKMEALGQLSGGIAHDYNNILAVINSSLHLLEKRLSQGQVDVQRYIDTVYESISRATHLTRRILAFARRQPLAVQSINLGSLVKGMHELISHSVGSHVSAKYRLDSKWMTLCDSNQMENVILNLAINARDALPTGGQLTITTDDSQFDKDVEGFDGFKAGEYVQLQVSDTGTGMSDEVRRKAFDPFFTTKPVGEGTGLGLSTTFGYIKQSNGFMKIDSELGKGTTITILMPRSAENHGDDL